MLAPLIGLGWTEVLVIAGVVFVLFGASRIPMAFRSLGEGINSFKEGLEGKENKNKGGEAPHAEAQTKSAPESNESGETSSAKS